MCQIKAPIAGNSKAIAKIGNAELVHFNKQMLIHELIRGSLGLLFGGRLIIRICQAHALAIPAKQGDDRPGRHVQEKE